MRAVCGMVVGMDDGQTNAQCESTDPPPLPAAMVTSDNDSLMQENRL